MKILLSAFFCRPGYGSEEGVGWASLAAAASQHDVWLATRPTEIPAIEGALPAGSSVRFVPVEGSDRTGVTTHRGLHLDYDRWQRRLAEEAVALHEEVRFDVVHHATMGSQWTRVGVASVDRPLVWGPVGATVGPPRALLGYLGLRGLAESFGRAVVRPLLARALTSDLADRPMVVLASDSPSAEHISRRLGVSDVVILPSGLCATLDELPAVDTRSHDVIVVSRLIPWKAVPLAIDVFAAADVPGSQLRVFGEGPERDRIVERARSVGVDDRVVMEGHVTRRELLEVIAGASVVLHTALHDQAPAIVAESLSLGTPLVCIDRAGAPDIVRVWGDVPVELVRPTTRDRVIEEMAAGVRRYLKDPVPVATAVVPPEVSFGEQVLAAYDRAEALAS